MYESFCYPAQAGWKLNGNRLTLTSVGTIKVKLHRGVQGTIKTCTIKREGNTWYVVLVCEVEASPRLPYTSLSVGIDLGLLHFATLSNADTIENPRYFRGAEKTLQKKSRALARKKRGSKRRKKADREVGKYHRKVRNQRADFLHKEARDLVNCYKTIVFEDLKPKNMSRRPKPKQDSDGKFLPNGAAAKGGLNKSIADASWGLLDCHGEMVGEMVGNGECVREDMLLYLQQLLGGGGRGAFERTTTVISRKEPGAIENGEMIL